MKYSDVIPNPDAQSDPLFTINDYPPERVAWDGANSISEYIELRGETLSTDEIDTLYKALGILRRAGA